MIGARIWMDAQDSNGTLELSEWLEFSKRLAVRGEDKAKRMVARLVQIVREEKGHLTSAVAREAAEAGAAGPRASSRAAGPAPSLSAPAVALSGSTTTAAAAAAAAVSIAPTGSAGDVAVSRERT